MSRLIDLTGQVFGRLEVLSRVSARGQSKWLCRCLCGNERINAGYALRNGLIKSCGCLRQSIAAVKNKKHGMTRTPEYMTWVNMRNRCYRPESRGYDRYGAKGITVCDRWLNSFENFFADMGARPSRYQLDRIDPAKGYSPENCRWATLIDQANNKKRVIQVTINGETMSVSDWCRRLNLCHRTIRSRIYERGWNPVDALTKPIGKWGG